MIKEHNCVGHCESLAELQQVCAAQETQDRRHCGTFESRSRSMSSMSHFIAEEIEKYRKDIEDLQEQIFMNGESNRMLKASFDKCHICATRIPADSQMQAVVKGSENVRYINSIVLR
jgi:hypothetical protein